MKNATVKKHKSRFCQLKKEVTEKKCLTFIVSEIELTFMFPLVCKELTAGLKDEIAISLGAVDMIGVAGETAILEATPR